MVEAAPKQDVVVVWLPKSQKATPADFARGEPSDDLDTAIVRARESLARQAGMLPWIRCDKKFVLSPEDVFAAYAQIKERR